MKITIYSKDGCTLCDKAVELCDEYNLTYEKLNKRKDELEIICGKKITAYPQIFIDEKYIGNILIVCIDKKEIRYPGTIFYNDFEKIIKTLKTHGIKENNI